jgi:hypothetical protein
LLVRVFGRLLVDFQRDEPEAVIVGVAVIELVVTETLTPNSCRKTPLTADELAIGVLHPALAQHLIGPVVGVFGDGESCH